MDDSCKRLTREEPNDHVNVVRHDAPGEEPVALFIKVAQRVHYFFRDCGISQVACAGAAVEKLFYDWSREALNFPTLAGTQIAAALVLLMRYLDFS